MERIEIMCLISGSTCIVFDLRETLGEMLALPSVSCTPGIEAAGGRRHFSILRAEAATAHTHTLQLA